MVSMKFALISFLVLPELAEEDIRALIRIEGWIADDPLCQYDMRHLPQSN